MKKRTSSSFVPNGQYPWNLKLALGKRTGCLFNCVTDDGTTERLPLYMLQEPVQELPPSLAFAITYISKSFFEVQMATSSSWIFSTKRECLDQNFLELSSSANNSASLLAPIKNSSAWRGGIHAKNAMVDQTITQRWRAGPGTNRNVSAVANSSLQQCWDGSFFSILLFAFSAIKGPANELRLSFILGEKYVNKIFLLFSGSESAEVSPN